MMKKVAIISVGVALPGEKGYTHTEYLARFLSQAGIDVTLIVPEFQHWEKKFRSQSIVEKLTLPYHFEQIKTIGYKKNLDLKRMLSYVQLGKKVVKYLKTHEKFDLLYVAIPSNYLGAQVVKYANKNNVPVIVNTGDLWPEAMKMVLHIPVITDVLYAPIAHYAKVAYKGADGFIGTSDEYRDQCLKYGADENKQRKTVYVGSELDIFYDGIDEFSDSVHKESGEFWVTYAGNLGASYDISTLIETARKISKDGYKNIKVKILGGGPDEDRLKERAKDLEDVVSFEGYQPYKRMAAYLSKSDLTINSFVKDAPQSIVTKVGDYMAAGKPMINTLTSPEFRKKVVDDNFGINVEAENVDELYNAIIYLYNNADIRNVMSENALKTAKTQFDRKESYKTILCMMNNLMEKWEQFK